MAKEKIKNSIWFVIFDGLKIYFSNIDKFILYMLFPVFGQIIGISLAFGLTVSLADKVAEKASSMTSAMGIIFLLALPGLLIFMKAFWDYMVAYVALNSMTEGALTTGHSVSPRSSNPQSIQIYRTSFGCRSFVSCGDFKLCNYTRNNPIVNYLGIFYFGISGLYI